MRRLACSLVVALLRLAWEAHMFKSTLSSVLYNKYIINKYTRVLTQEGDTLSSKTQEGHTLSSATLSLEPSAL
jgi:hypothetical protein